MSEGARSQLIGKKCVICCENAPIKNSHVLPRFVFRWMIKTGGSQFLRHAGAPNKRVQDGFKYPLLCGDCETRTSLVEKHFAEHIFKPSVENGALPKRTGRKEYDFVCLNHLRSMAYFSIEGKMDKISNQEVEMRFRAIDTIGAYLNGETHSAVGLKFYLLPFGVGELSDLRGAPPNWHRYIRRHTEFDTIGNDTGSLFGSYYKLGPWLSFCLIKNEGQRWLGADINVTRSRWDRRITLPPSILDFLFDRAETSKRIMHSMSDKQKKVVQEAILSGDILTEGRPMFDAIMADLDAFGPQAFE